MLKKTFLPISWLRDPESQKTTSGLLKDLYNESCMFFYRLQLKYSRLGHLEMRLFTSVAGAGCLSRIRIFPSRILGQKDSGSQISDPDPHKNFKYLNKQLFLSPRQYDPGCHPGSGSRLRILIFYPFWISDPGSRD